MCSVGSFTTEQVGFVDALRCFRAIHNIVTCYMHVYSIVVISNH